MNKKYLMIGVICAIILTIIFNIFLPDNKESYEQIFRKSITKDENIDSTLFYRSVFGGIARVSKDGISLYNTNGDLVWIKPWTMKSPLFDAKGNYVCVADKGGNDIWIFDKNGIVGECKTEKVINKIALTKEGFVYALLEDEDFSYVNLFDKNGNIKDISIKYSISGEGYPIDISASNDATELLVSLGYVNNQQFSSKLLFYNFDEVGKNISADRIVGSFKDEYENNYIAKVHFSDNIYSQSFYDGGVDFFSTKILTKADFIERKKFDKKIISIDYNDDIVSIILENGELIVLDKKGNTLSSKNIKIDYDDFYMENSYMVFHNKNTTSIYDKNGTKIYEGKLPNNAIRVCPIQSMMGLDLLVGSNNDIYKLRIK